MPAISYHVLDRSTAASKGWLTDVLAEPNFDGKLNDGAQDITLRTMDDPRTVLALLDLIEITHPDGTVMGRWKFEGATQDGSKDDAWTLTLLALRTELQDVDFGGNYTDIPATFHNATWPVLGRSHFDRPVVDAIPRTKHCTLIYHASDGVLYSLDLRDLHVLDALVKATDLGGPDWWFYCDGMGRVELSHTPRAIHTISWQDCIWRQPTMRAQTIYNVQPLNGGSVLDANSFPTPLYSLRETTGGPYGTATVGRRVAGAWSDPSVKDVATLNQLGDAILARCQTSDDGFVARLRPGLARVICGDKLAIAEADGSTTGPYWVTQHSEEGSTGVQVVTASKQFGAYHDRPAAAFQQALGGLGSLYNGSQIASSGGGGTDCCGGFVPFLHPNPGTAVSIPNGDIHTASFEMNSGGQVQLRGFAQLDISAATALGGPLQIVLTIGTQTKTRPILAVPGSMSIELITDVPLADGVYDFGLSIENAIDWTVAYDYELCLVG